MSTNDRSGPSREGARMQEASSHQPDGAAAKPELGQSVASERGRKWIDRRIETLDPYRDYSEIWALSYIYNVTDFELHWAYTVSNSHLGLTKWGADAAYRDGEGAMIVDAEARTANTNDHMLLWAEHGPDSPVTQHAIEIVNKQHAKWAKRYPGAFSHSEDYIYLFSDAATSMHRLRLDLGLQGWSQKQQIAAHRYWCGIAELFEVEGGAPLVQVEPMPENFKAMADYAEAYTTRPWPKNPIGAEFTEELIGQFLGRWFSVPLARPFGRALITTFFSPTLFRIYEMSPPSRFMQFLARSAVKLGLLYKDYIRPDEKLPITERRRRSVGDPAVRPSRIDESVHRAVDSRGGGGSCPHSRL